MTRKVGLYRDTRNKHRPWVVRWFGEYDPAKGKERHYSKAFALKRDAEAFQATKRAEFDRGGVRDVPEEIGLGEFIRRFRETKGKAQRAATRNIYDGTFEQLIDHFGAHTPISRITPELADQFMATRNRVAKHGNGFSPASRNQHLRNCKAAFKVAVDWGHLARNPFAKIKQQKISTREWHHLRPTEFQELLSVVGDLRWRAFYLLGYTTGARFGELFNLTWSGIDFERCTMTIDDRSGTAEMPPFLVKDHEARTLLLPRQTVDALIAWHAEAPERVPYVLLKRSRWQRVLERWRLCRAKEPWKQVKQSKELTWVEWENRYMVNNVLRTVKAHVQKAHLSLTAPMTIQTLRKSFAQNHANSGTPVSTLKTLMGHASITTTEKYYLQHCDEAEQAAAKRYGELLAGKTCVRIAYEGSEEPQSAAPSNDPTSEVPADQGVT